MAESDANQEPKILGLIPARGGSKVVPRKNLRMLGNRPLVEYSIREAMSSGCITRTVCSTDDAEIAETARRCGAEVPFLRPAELAGDASTDADYTIHAVEWLRDNEGWLAHLVVILWPTCPLRKTSDIDGAVRMLLDNPDADSVVSVIPPQKSPYKMWRRTDAGYLVPLLTSHVFEQFAGPRQRLPEVLAPNGYVHVVRAETVLQSSSILGFKVLPYEMDAAECIDIDSEEDFKIAEALMHNSKRG